MKINLTSIHLRNFKGAKNVNINFSDVTTIKGDNGTGKTTVFDAFNWVLWGKNSANESSFEIKSLDSDNNYTSQQEHEVVLLLTSDSNPIELKRVYKEKWTKKRGSEIAELTGHDTDFFVNDVPKSKGEYDSYINGLINPSIARLITDPLFFNVHLKWNERRDILSGIAGEIDNNSVIDQISSIGKDFSELINVLNSGKSLSDKKKEIGVKKKLLKDELTQIPSRIDEVERARPVAKDWENIKAKLIIEENNISKVNDELSDIQKAQQGKYAEISENDAKRFQIEQNIQSETRRIESELNKDREIAVSKKRAASEKIVIIERENAEMNGKVINNLTLIKDNKDLIDTYRGQWKKLNESPVVTTETLLETCPTCKGPISEEKLSEQREEITKRANEKRIQDLNTFVKNAEKLIDQNKGLEAENKNLQSKIDENEIQLTALKVDESIIIPEKMPFTDSETLISLKKQLEETPKIELTPVDLTELTRRKNEISERIANLKAELIGENDINRANKRIFELTESQKTLSQELASLENIEIQIDQFNKAKIDLVESKVNGLFEIVKFKMFDQQINGGESPSCVCMVNGVPFSDLNTASKINAGVDIINALQKHFDFYAPIFIDNRESVTNILQTNCQVVNLVKVEGLDVLTVE